MINLIFYIALAIISFIIAALFTSIDSYFEQRKQKKYNHYTKDMFDTVWFYKYEKYRKGVTGNATEKRNV